ncbi:MAG: MmgE/PrpD family protein [Pseudonocardia sp.]|nr:MmgE/PrpD family protein [Pseudonocardia sp.]
MTALTQSLVDLVCRGAPPADAWLHLGERAAVDTVGVLLTGAADPAVEIVAGTLDEEGGPVRSLSTGRMLAARSAALVDGTAAHALDFDDVDDALIAHPSAVLVPALLAAGQNPDVTGAAILDAYALGLLAGRIVAGALGVTGHYALGWHSTGTIGTVAATAAIARLQQLDDDAVRRALGVAGSLAAGSRQNFGTMTKPLHAGTAAAHGILAARLAAGGFTSDPQQMDGPLGFLALHSDGPSGVTADPELPIAVNVKLFPCCYATHSAAEAALALSREVDDPRALTEIEVAVPGGGLAPLVHHRPVTGAQAKFSMEYVVAEALLRGRLGLASFAEDRVGARDVQDLLPQVRAREEPGADVAAVGSFARVTARDADGREHVAAVDRPLGHASRPVDEAALEAKFADCAPAADPRLFHDLRRLRDRPSVAELASRIALAAATGAGR